MSSSVSRKLQLSESSSKLLNIKDFAPTTPNQSQSLKAGLKYTEIEGKQLEAYSKTKQEIFYQHAKIIQSYCLSQLEKLNKETIEFSEICPPDRMRLLQEYRFICSDIIPDARLCISGLYVAQNYDILINHQITHIINLAGDICPNCFPEKFSYVTFKLQDHRFANAQMESILTNIINYIVYVISTNPESKLLIHCKEGVSRSATVLVAYLMWITRLSFSEVLDIVRDKRPTCNPNTGFTYTLLRFSKFLNDMEQPPLKLDAPALHESNRNSYCYSELFLDKDEKRMLQTSSLFFPKILGMPIPKISLYSESKLVPYDSILFSNKNRVQVQKSLCDTIRNCILYYIGVHDKTAPFLVTLLSSIYEPLQKSWMHSTNNLDPRFYFILRYNEQIFFWKGTEVVHQNLTEYFFISEYLQHLQLIEGSTYLGYPWQVYYIEENKEPEMFWSILLYGNKNHKNRITTKQKKLDYMYLCLTQNVMNFTEYISFVNETECCNSNFSKKECMNLFNASNSLNKEENLAETSNGHLSNEIDRITCKRDTVSDAIGFEPNNSYFTRQHETGTQTCEIPLSTSLLQKRTVIKNDSQESFDSEISLDRSSLKHSSLSSSHESIDSIYGEINQNENIVTANTRMEKISLKIPSILLDHLPSLDRLQNRSLHATPHSTTYEQFDQSVSPSHPSERDLLTTYSSSLTSNSVALSLTDADLCNSQEQYTYKECLNTNDNNLLDEAQMTFFCNGSSLRSRAKYLSDSNQSNFSPKFNKSIHQQAINEKFDPGCDDLSSITHNYAGYRYKIDLSFSSLNQNQSEHFKLPTSSCTCHRSSTSHKTIAKVYEKKSLLKSFSEVYKENISQAAINITEYASVPEGSIYLEPGVPYLYSYPHFNNPTTLFNSIDLKTFGCYIIVQYSSIQLIKMLKHGKIKTNYCIYPDSKQSYNKKKSNYCINYEQILDCDSSTFQSINNFYFSENEIIRNSQMKTACLDGQYMNFIPLKRTVHNLASTKRSIRSSTYNINRSVPFNPIQQSLFIGFYKQNYQVQQLYFELNEHSNLQKHLLCSPDVWVYENAKQSLQFCCLKNNTITKLRTSSPVYETKSDFTFSSTKLWIWRGKKWKINSSQALDESLLTSFKDVHIPYNEPDTILEFWEDEGFESFEFQKLLWLN